MKLTILLLILPVLAFWSFTEYWQLSGVLFWIWIPLAVACIARGVSVCRYHRLLGLVCIGAVAVQVLFLVVPRLLHAGRRTPNERSALDAPIALCFQFERHWSGASQSER